MESDRTCKRCSVTRVNTLCRSYEKAHAPGGDRAMKALKEVATLVRDRGYDNAGALLVPGMNEKDLRAQCWNVSSFLKDEEADIILGGV